MSLALIDTSVWAHVAKSARIRLAVADLVLEKRVAVCVPILLEIFRTARDRDHYRVLREWFSTVGLIRVDRAVEERALAVQRLLVERGQHRGIGRTDLLAAACAEAAGATLLHHDRDYERIAAITGQLTEFVAP